MDLIIVTATTSTSLLLGLFTFLKNPKSDTHRFLAFLSFIIAFWAAANYISLNPPSKESTLFWIRFTMPPGAFMGPTIYFLVRAFPHYKVALSKSVLVVIWAFTLITSIVALSPYMFTSVNFVNGHAQPQAGPGMVFFVINFLGFLFLAFVTLIQKYRRASGLEKVQLRFLMIGVILTFSLLSITTLVFVNVFKITSLVPLGSSYPLILVSFISYAIIRHRLLDINLVVARAVAYSIVITLIGIFYVGSTFILSSVFLGSTALGNQLLIYTILTIIVALSFERLRHVVENLTDKIFFKGRYDSNQLLSRLGSIMSTNIELGSLTAQILRTLAEQMKVSKGAFVILGEELGSIYDIIDIGFPRKLTVSYNQISVFISFPQIIVFDELEENNLKSLMREMDISVIKTLKVKDKVVGFLFLGAKASGEIYSQQDLKVLEILAPEVAVAIQNSESYDKIKKFNVILSEEIRKATMDLQEANSRLKTMDKLKDDFVSIASHELRTPMTAIRSYAWMALNRADIHLSETMEKYIARILISTERLINLVNDMLNVSRIESGRIEINPEPVDLLSLAKDIVDELYYSKSPEKKVEFVVLEKPIPKVLADPDKLRQVFLNLVGNSLKFTPAGGKIVFDFFTDGKVVETSVSDNGVGMSKEDLSKLFSKFGRLDNSYTAAATSGGTGLGLYISKNLVELMHGKIWADSEGLNKGATFIVSLPVATPETLKDIDRYRVKPKGEVKGLEPVAI